MSTLENISRSNAGKSYGVLVEVVFWGLQLA